MEQQPDKCASRKVFGRPEEQLAQKLTKFFQAGSWVLNQLTPAAAKNDCSFSDLIGMKA